MNKDLLLHHKEFPIANKREKFGGMDFKDLQEKLPYLKVKNQKKS